MSQDSRSAGRVSISVTRGQVVTPRTTGRGGSNTRTTGAVSARVVRVGLRSAGPAPEVDTSGVPHIARLASRNTMAVTTDQATGENPTGDIVGTLQPEAQVDSGPSENAGNPPPAYLVVTNPDQPGAQNLSQLVASVIAHDFRTSSLLCLYIFWTLLPSRPPHSFISHLISRHQDRIRLLREIDKDKMSIYKGTNHALHLCLETHGFSELGI